MVCFDTCLYCATLWCELLLPFILHAPLDWARPHYPGYSIYYPTTLPTTLPSTLPTTLPPTLLVYHTTQGTLPNIHVPAQLRNADQRLVTYTMYMV